MSCRLAQVLFVAVIATARPTWAEDRPPSPPAETAGRGPATWLIASGGLLFGATYVISFGMASAGQGCGNAFLGMDCVPQNDRQGTDWPLFLPIVGPFVAMGTSKDRPIGTLAVLGAGQVAGAALLFSGFAVRTPSQSTSRIEFSPSFYAGGAGLSLARRF